jgi:DnaJ family protein A protein 1
MVKETKYYDILNLDPNCSIEDVKKAYKKQALIHHPDKNESGDDTKFKEISKAYEILSNEETRSMYDMNGEDFINNNYSEDSNNIFNMFFRHHNSFGYNNFHQTNKIGQDIIQTIKLTLEEIYNGTTKSILIKKNIICDLCNGLGGKKNFIKKCNTCNGNGITISKKQFSGLTQYIHQTCPACLGMKEIINPTHKCKKCNGIKTIQIQHKLEINIQKGMFHNQKIIFSKEGNQIVNGIPGDVIIIIDIQKHPIFHIINKNDLAIEIELYLVEALCGFTKVIKTLDNRNISFTIAPGEVITGNLLKYIKKEGLYKFKNNTDKGNLIIKFNIMFPNKIDIDKIDNLEKCLSAICPRPIEKIPKTAISCDLYNYKYSINKDNDSKPDVNQCKMN